RIATLLRHDISLFSYHLPLDAHPELGNNAQLAKLLNISVEGVLDERELQGVGNIGFLAESTALSTLSQQLAQQLEREPLVIAGGDHPIKRIAWCSGGAQHYIQQAHALGADAYISGEISENTVHFARENGIHYIAAGHHATERYGIKALGTYLADAFALIHHFVDINNPV
ncbi:MAG: Nif3-like dinuclear metal center hexameric protein, partial [Thiothrix sp.]